MLTHASPQPIGEDPEPNGPERAHTPRAAVAVQRAETFRLVCGHMRSLAGPYCDDFDDLVQTAAEQVLRSLSRFEGRSSLSTWVYRVCYHVLGNHRQWHKRWVKRMTLTTSGDVFELQPPSAAPDAERVERNRRIWAAVERLSPKLRAVVVLRDLEGMSIEEIAQIVEAKPLTVRSRLRDGRKTLLGYLRKDPYFEQDVLAFRGRS